MEEQFLSKPKLTTPSSDNQSVNLLKCDIVAFFLSLYFKEHAILARLETDMTGLIIDIIDIDIIDINASSLEVG